MKISKQGGSWAKSPAVTTWILGSPSSSVTGYAFIFFIDLASNDWPFMLISSQISMCTFDHSSYWSIVGFLLWNIWSLECTVSPFTSTAAIPVGAAVTIESGWPHPAARKRSASITLDFPVPPFLDKWIRRGFPKGICSNDLLNESKRYLPDIANATCCLSLRVNLWDTSSSDGLLRSTGHFEEIFLVDIESEYILDFTASSSSLTATSTLPFSGENVPSDSFRVRDVAVRGQQDLVCFFHVCCLKRSVLWQIF